MFHYSPKEVSSYTNSIVMLMYRTISGWSVNVLSTTVTLTSNLFVIGSKCTIRVEGPFWDNFSARSLQKSEHGHRKMIPWVYPQRHPKKKHLCNKSLQNGLYSVIEGQICTRKAAEDSGTQHVRHTKNARNNVQGQCSTSNISYKKFLLSLRE